MKHRSRYPRLSDVKAMSAEELNEQFGVVLEDDGGIYDPLDCTHYRTIAEWWEFAENDLEPETTFIPRSKSKGYDD